MNHSNPKVLITGGNGSIGKYLQSYLSLKGIQVCILTRDRKKVNGINIFYWNIDTNEIDLNAFKNVSTIIHLAGAGIADKRWTIKRKKEIMTSRIRSAALIFDTIQKHTLPIQNFISSSGIGYYGIQNSDHVYMESDAPGNDFLAQTCIQWENAADQFSTLGLRIVKFRCGVVLMKNGGMLSKLKNAFRFHLLPVFGNGNQIFSWIHIDDLCEVYYQSIINNHMEGAYNAVTPAYITQGESMHTLKKTFNSSYLILPIPKWVLKFILGELATSLINGNRISSNKLLKQEFTFQFPDLDNAIANLLS